MRFKNLRKGLHIPTIELYAGSLMQEVSKSSSVLWHIYPKTVLSQQPKSRSEKKYKISIKLIASFHEKMEGIYVILDNVPKVKRNGNTNTNHYVVDCPSQGIHDCAKNLCVFKISGGIYILWNQMDNMTCNRLIEETTSRCYMEKRRSIQVQWIWLIIISISFNVIVFIGMNVGFSNILTLTTWSLLQTVSRELQSPQWIGSK